MEPIKKILRTPSAFVLLLVAIVSLIGIIIKSETDKAIARIPIDATLNAEATLTALSNLPSIISSPTPSSQDLALTAIAIENRLTQEAGAIATQQYLEVREIVQANATATSLYEQVVAEQTQNVEATVQAILSTQQTATAIANNQKIEQLRSFANQIPNLPVLFYDSFEDNKNGWSPKKYGDYSISLKGDVLTAKLLSPSTPPLVWSCEKCNSFNNFSYQIDIQTPKDTSRVVSGIIFGSPIKLDRQPLQEYYLLLIYSSGDIVLERVSPSGNDIIEIWEHRQDLLTPDGEFHTLQVITIDNFAAVYLDNKPVGDVFSLDYSAQGYIGIVVQSPDIDVAFDNLKVVLMP